MPIHCMSVRPIFGVRLITYVPHKQIIIHKFYFRPFNFVRSGDNPLDLTMKYQFLRFAFNYKVPHKQIIYNFYTRSGPIKDWFQTFFLKFLVFQLYHEIGFIGGGNQITRRKPSACHLSLATCHSQIYYICCIKYTSPSQ